MFEMKSKNKKLQMNLSDSLFLILDLEVSLHFMEGTMYAARVAKLQLGVALNPAHNVAMDIKLLESNALGIRQVIHR